MFAVIALLIVVGVALYLLPINEKIKTLIIVIVIVAVCLWLLSALGFTSHSPWRVGWQ